MRDGKVVAADARRAFDRDTLVAAMGGVGEHVRDARGENARPPDESRARCVRARPARQIDGAELVAHEGEIVGLAGLAGHGQTELLLAIFDAAHRAQAPVSR